jgi:hypothetical protein
MINLADMGAAGAEPLFDVDELGSEVAPAESGEVGEIARVAGLGRGDTSSGYPAAAILPPPRPGETSGSIERRGDLYTDDEPGGNRRTWVVLALILLVGIGIAAAIGLSGPEIGPGTGTSDPAPP